LYRTARLLLNTLGAIVMAVTLVACISDDEDFNGSANGDSDGAGDSDGGRCRRLDCSCYEPTFQCAFEGEPYVEIMRGTLLLGFMPIEESSELQVQRGPNFSYILALSVCVRHMWPGRTDDAHDTCEDPQIQFWVNRAADGEEFSSATPPRTGLHPSIDNEDCLERREVWLHLPFDRADDWDGQRARLHVSVTDACSRVASDEVEVVLVL